MALDLVSRLEAYRAEEQQLAWRGTFKEYFDLVVENPRLARLYDPNEGRILLDGHDLRDYDLEVLRRNIGVIFQDFVRYHLTAAENIAVGRIEARHDRARIVEAARRSLADDVIAGLPKGYDQVIGKRFRNGVDLSGGEWQKVAIARAYMRDSQLLILDEPTAALDARSEFEVFQRFKELSDGRTAVLISHRFSSVRMADRILVLSTFSRKSFEDEGTPVSRISMVPLGVQVDAFRPPPEIVSQRRRRILTGQPLRVLFVGTVSYRKGFLDFATVVEKLQGHGFSFEVVGPILPECAPLVDRLRGKATFAGKRPQADLPASYHAADLFLFPTIEDGFAAVLAQAKAAALPILTTAHGAGLDLITPGQDGWIVPVREPGAIVDRLIWCGANRPIVASVVKRVYDTFRPRDWNQVATHFEAVCVAATEIATNASRRSGSKTTRWP